MKRRSAKKLRAGENFHQETVRRIHDEPSLLGLELGEVLDREMGPELKKRGIETIDLILVTEQEGVYQIFGIEVKVGIFYAAKYSKRMEAQFNITRKFFARHWQHWLEKKGVEPKGKEVWLILLLVSPPGILIKERTRLVEEQKLGTF